MDWVEQQEQYHPHNIKGNYRLKNQVKNLIEKFLWMDKKLNALRDLISDLATQTSENKRKYESESSDCREKKEAKSNVQRQIFLSYPAGGNCSMLCMHTLLWSHNILHS